MRHFLCLALPPRPLPGGMQPRPAVAQLVEFTSAAHGLAPVDLGALTRAVNVAAVTVAADAHPLCAAPATIQPIRLLARTGTHGLKLSPMAAQDAPKKLYPGELAH